MKRYRIISELGKGATGVVFRALRSSNGETVALKKLVLPGHLDSREEENFIRRFKTEAEAALTIDHPGVVKCLDCGLDEGTFYIAYELVEGVTLENALKSGREFQVDEVLDYLLQATDALQFAHEKGVIHRDISPGNIFINQDGKIQIADFGVAHVKSRATLTGTGDIVGTPGYMSPEQVTSSEIDHRSDIFALGCVFYELLTSTQAFQGDNLPQVIHRVLNTQPKPVRDINPSVPLSVEEIIFRMLAKNPQYRYQTMQEVNSAASRVLETLPRQQKISSKISENHQPCLVVMKGPHEGQKFDLLPTVTTIGRIIGDVLLKEDASVSSQHAWITHEQNSWVLYDADTESGTFLSGERIEQEEILPGDRFRVGETVLEFRGAGGHSGVFAEIPEQVVESEGKSTGQKTSEKARNINWVPVILLSGLGLIAIAVIVLVAFVLPWIFTSNLNTITDDRWDSAFGQLTPDLTMSGTWNITAGEILDDWSNSPLPQKESLYPPDYLFNSDSIKQDVDYRYSLFDFAGDFLQATQSIGGLSEINVGSTGFASIRTIEARISSLAVPRSANRSWEGRKNQLLGLVRRYLTGPALNQDNRQGTTGEFSQEIQQAQMHLLNGWYLYRELGADFNILEQAFNEYQTCRQVLVPILESDPDNDDAMSVSGLAAILAARVLRDVGTAARPDRYQRGLDILDEAETMVVETSDKSWEVAVPTDFKSSYPNRQSALAQLHALRQSLQNLIDSSGGANITGEGTG